MERKLKERLDLPAFPDDPHGTAVITVSAMLNALKLVGKDIGEVSAVVNGAGAAGTACTKLLMALGLKNVVVCDKMGALVPGLPGMTPAQAQLAEETNPQRKSGSLAEVIQGADVFMGFSAPGVLTGDMVKTMAQDALVFALSLIHIFAMKPLGSPPFPREYIQEMTDRMGGQGDLSLWEAKGGKGDG